MNDSTRPESGTNYSFVHEQHVLDREDRQATENYFVYHPPGGNQATRFEQIREEAREFAHHLVRLCPPGPDRTTAIAKLREAVFFANAAIACGEVDGASSVRVVD